MVSRAYNLESITQTMEWYGLSQFLSYLPILLLLAVISWALVVFALLPLVKFAKTKKSFIITLAAIYVILAVLDGFSFFSTALGLLVPYAVIVFCYRARKRIIKASWFQKGSIIYGIILFLAGIILLVIIALIILIAGNIPSYTFSLGDYTYVLIYFLSAILWFKIWKKK